MATDSNLISHLETCVSIRGNALSWITSYLQNRSFSVQMGDSMLTSAPLSFGIPQGSVLAPFVCLYMLPLGQISVNMVCLFTVMQMTPSCIYL